MPGEPPATPPDIAGRDCGADMLPFGGGGSGWLCTARVLLGTEPVTSLGADCGRDENGFSVKRVDSELQLTADTAITAKTAGRNHGSERSGSTTLRIRPTHSYTHKRGGELNTGRVNKPLTYQDSLNPNKKQPYC